MKGPSSIFYGEIQPGGAINIVTELPSSEPFYEAELQIGSEGLVRPQIDISEPLNDDRSLLYRLNAVYSRRDSYRNFDQEFEQLFIAPVLTWKISDRTNLTVDVQLSSRERPWDFRTVAVGDGVLDAPRDRIFNEPDDYLERDFLLTRLNLEHKFSNNWSLRSAFRFTNSSTFSDKLSIPIAFDETTGDLTRVFALDDFDSQEYALHTNVVGEFETGSIEHTVLFGVDLTQSNTSHLLKPDLILGDSRGNKEEYTQLSQIAPTLLFEYVGNNKWQEPLRTVAKVLQRTDRAEAAIKTYQQQIETTRQALAPVAKSHPTVLMVASEQLTSPVELATSVDFCGVYCRIWGFG